MATYYTGYRNVLKGRDSDEMVNPLRAKQGVYTFNPLFSTSHVLDDAPDVEIKLGDPRPYSQPNLMEKIYAGHHHIAPLNEPGLGPVTNYSYNTTLYGGLESSRALNDPGHLSRTLYYSRYTNFEFNGLPALQPLTDPGHLRRYDLSYSAAFRPWEYKGITTQPMNDPGHLIPTDSTSLYGSNKVNEWRGVPSSQAL